jgi:hypothetical protein
MESQIVATDGESHKSDLRRRPTSAGAPSRAPARGSRLFSFSSTAPIPFAPEHDLDRQVDLMLADAEARAREFSDPIAA